MIENRVAHLAGAAAARRFPGLRISYRDQQRAVAAR